MVDIGHKVRDILLVRHARNRIGGRKTIPLSRDAQAIATGRSFPSKSWFKRFFGYHHDVLNPKVQQAVSSSRAAVANEATVVGPSRRAP